MNQPIRILFHMLAAMALCVAVLLLSACIPRGMIQKQSENSAQYFAERAPFAILIGDYVNAMQDNYSDTVLCDIAYFIDPAHPFSSVIRAKYAHNKYEEAYAGYLSAVKGEAEPNMEYGRYWHGSLAFIRPLLVVMPIGGIRILCGALAVGMQLGIAGILIRRGNRAFAVCWLAALMAVHPWMFFTSLEYGTAFLAASAASLALLLTRSRTDDGTMPFFAVTGVVTCFVDFLTTETMTFTLPMLLLLAERHLSKAGKANVPGGAKEACLSVIKNGLCWLGGYVGMFLLKLGMLALVAGEEVMRSSLSEGLFRLGGEVRTANISTAPVVDFGTQLGGAVWHNLACLYPTHAGQMQAAGVWLATLVIAAVGAIAVYLLHEEIEGECFLPMALTALVPYLRVLVLSNHSYVHFFITYRAQMAAIAVFLFFVYENGLRNLITASRSA